MEAVHAVLIRDCAIDDLGEWSGLWIEYLHHLSKAGSPILVSAKNLRLYADAWRSVVLGMRPGVALIAPGAAASLWTGEPEFELSYGKVMQGLGTYVRPEFRGQGLGRAMYEAGFKRLRALGYDAFMGSVDSGNALGARNAERLHGEVFQTVQVVRL